MEGYREFLVQVGYLNRIQPDCNDETECEAETTSEKYEATRVKLEGRESAQIHENLETF